MCFSYFKTPYRRLAVLGAMGCGLLVCFDTILPVETAAQNPAAIQESEDIRNRRLQQYLNRLGLVDLATRELEDRFRKETDREKKLEIASRLAAQYNRQIVSSLRLAGAIENRPAESRDNRIRDKLQSLQQQFEELRHPRYSTALISVDFSILQNAFFAWATGPADDKQRQALAKRFQEQRDAWSDVYLDVTEQVDRYNRKIDASFETPAIRNQVDELTAIQSQLEFIGGWIQYYLAICEPNLRAESLDKSQELFLSLLQLGEREEILTLTADQLELEVDWFARAMIALACIAGANQDEGLREKLFQLLDDPKVAASIRAELDWWEFHSFAFVSDWKSAAALAIRKLKKMESGQEPASSRFWATIANTVAREIESKDTEPLLLLAFQGMARENQFPAINEIIKKQKLKIDSNRFVASWIRGQSEYTTAEEKLDRQKFQTAKRLFELALESKEPSVGRIDRAQCRYLLGWIQFRLGQFESAEKRFRQASLGLRYFDPDTAAKALWVRTMALKKIKTDEQVDELKLLTALNELVRLFPNTTYAEKASFEITRIQFAKTDPRQAIDRLKQLPKENSNYRPAQFEIVRLYYQLMNSDNLEPSNRKPSEDEFTDFVERFCADDKNRVAQKTKSIILIVDYLLTHYPEQYQRAEKWNQRAEAFASQLEKTSLEYADVRFQSYRIAKKSGDDEKVAREATWLASRQNQQENYKSVGLIFLANRIEKQLKTADASSRRTLLSEAKRIYQQLCEFLDTSELTLKRTANARISFSRLADIEAELGEIDEAIRRYEILHSAMPNHQLYILRLAQLKTRSGRGDQAIVFWRKLVQGSESGSDIWFEAKFNVIQYLAKSDPEAALAVLQQTTQLSPKLPDPWKAKFAAARAKLEKQ